MAGTQGSARLRAIYDRIAPLYDVLDLPFEMGRYRAIRSGLFKDLRGVRRLLDCGVGTGQNIPFYPRGAQVTGVDLCGRMLHRARHRSGRVGREVRLVQGDVLALPLPDDAYDAAAGTFLFCVLPDEIQVAALREIARVVRPGGRIVLLEYVLSEDLLRRAVMRLWAPWVRLVYGAGFDRRTEVHVEEAGLRIEERRFVHADIILALDVRVPD